MSDEAHTPGRTIVHTSNFSTHAAGLLDEAAIRGLEERLAMDPTAGDVMPGAGGVRKLRIAARGKGRRGGARVIYYFADLDDVPIYLLDIYGKGDVDDLTEVEKQALRVFAKGIVAAHRKRR